jgi:hypothetical protein
MCSGCEEGVFVHTPIAWEAHLTPRDQYLVVRTEKYGRRWVDGKSNEVDAGKAVGGFCVGESVGVVQCLCALNAFSCQPVANVL